MQQVGRLEVRGSTESPTAPRAPLVVAGVAAQAVSAAVVITADAAHVPLGAPDYWPWLLTGLQVVALWAAGVERSWGWLLGASVQIPWIAYAVVTGQLGFIPGCAVSAAVQTHNFWVSDRGGRPVRDLRCVQVGA